MGLSVVSTHSLTKRYGETIGVADLDLELLPGEVFGFIGPNGAGKTTTIRLLLDLIRPTSGSATVFGLDSRDSAVEIRRRVGYLPARLTLQDRMTPTALFDWLGRLRPDHDPQRAADLAERLKLDCGRKIGELSSGNRQKVGLVQALMHQPDLLILDEPTSGLDPLVRREFRSLLVEARSTGTTVLLSSHVLAEVEGICDRVGTIVGGRLRNVTTVEELRLLSRRHIQVTFDGNTPEAALAAIPGVRNLATERSGRLSVVSFDAVGPIDDVIKEIATGTVIDLASRSMSLEELFIETYDGTSDGQPTSEKTTSDKTSKTNTAEQVRS